MYRSSSVGHHQVGHRIIICHLSLTGWTRVTLHTVATGWANTKGHHAAVIGRRFVGAGVIIIGHFIVNTSSIFAGLSFVIAVKVINITMVRYRHCWLLLELPTILVVGYRHWHIGCIGRLVITGQAIGSSTHGRHWLPSHWPISVIGWSIVAVVNKFQYHYQ
jgi:hypothetical protein